MKTREELHKVFPGKDDVILLVDDKKVVVGEAVAFNQAESRFSGGQVVMITKSSAEMNVVLPYRIFIPYVDFVEVERTPQRITFHLSAQKVVEYLKVGMKLRYKNEANEDVEEMRPATFVPLKSVKDYAIVKTVTELYHEFRYAMARAVGATKRDAAKKPALQK